MEKISWQKIKIKESERHQELAYHTVNELVFKERQGRVLTLTDERKLIDFVSCSYLGLDLDQRVVEACKKNIARYGVTFPAARTRIKANSFIVLESLLNKIFCDAYSVIFSSLHVAHLGFLPLLGSGKLPSFPSRSKGCCFILDKKVHSCIQINRALMQQFGEVIILPFSNTQALQHAFKKAEYHQQTPIAISDSIGSMGGVSPINELLALAEQYGGYIYFDDAHGMSIYGKNGCGYVLEKLDYQFSSRLVLTTSLAKAFGAIAGVIVLPTKEDIAMVKKYASTYIFGGPPALPIIDAAIASSYIHLSDEIYILQNKLKSNLELLDSLLSDKLINAFSPSPIRGISIGDEILAIKKAKYMQNEGVAVTTAMYPTVAQGDAMLRIAVSAQHTTQQIKLLADIVQSINFRKK